MLREGAKMLREGAKMLREGAKMLREGAKMLREGAKMLTSPHYHLEFLGYPINSVITDKIDLSHNICVVAFSNGEGL
jgi:hypothetical protein